MTESGPLLRPDTGETVAPAMTPTPVEPSKWDHIAVWLGTIPTAAWITLAAIVALAVVVRAVRKRRGDQRPAKSDKLMTFFGAAVATGVVGTGMWAFFGDTLGIDNVWLRAALFAFFEIAMLASALRSRRFRLDRAATQSAEDKRRAEVLATNPDATFPDDDSHEVDVDGAAVWVLALLSGTLAATHETAVGAIGLRLVAPLIAAWLWERGLAGELRQFRRTSSRRKVNWKITPERVAVWLGLAEPTGREVGQVDRARRIARFARTAYRLHTLEKNGAFRARIAFAQWRLRRQVEQINEHLSLATDRAVMADVRAHLATYYQVHAGTAPKSVGDLTPWLTIPTEPLRVQATTGHPMAVGSGHQSDTDTDTMSRPVSATVSDIAPHMTLDMLSGLATRQVSDTVADTTPATDSDTRRDVEPDSVTDAVSGQRQQARPTGRTRRGGTSVPTSSRAPRWTAQQLRAFRLRDDDGLTYELIARRLNVTTRTIERWFKKREQVAAGDDKELAMRPDILTVLPAPRPPVTSGTNGHRIEIGVTPTSE
jgi:hypothetical protein